MLWRNGSEPSIVAILASRDIKIPGRQYHAKYHQTGRKRPAESAGNLGHQQSEGMQGTSDGRSSRDSGSEHIDHIVQNCLRMAGPSLNRGCMAKPAIMLVTHSKTAHPSL
jgi:hypothetical protein